MNLVSIGEFTVDLDERRIYKAGAELSAEPKVIEVLCYLIQNNERFISLSELHENVWAGRVVTDTAVRRTISKLRTLLDDNETENPRYIRSQMKRGYQIINVQLSSSFANPSSEVTLPSGTISLPTKVHANKTRFYSYSIVFVILSLLIAGFYAFTDLQKADIVPYTVDTLLDIPGEKFSLTVSADGRYQAFVGRLNNAEKWQAYLNDSQTGQLSRLSVPGDSIYSLSFVGNKLAAVSYSNGVASLYLNTEDSIFSDFSKVELSGYPLMEKAVALDANTVLLNLAESHNSALLYYIYNLTEQSIAQFSFSNNNSVRDYNAVKSPSGQQLALTRWDASNKLRSIQVYRLDTAELIADWPLPSTAKITAMEWLNETDLLLATGTELKELNLKNGFLKKPIHIQINGLVRDATGKLFALQNENSSLQVYETTIPYDEAFTRRFQLGDAVEQFYFSETDEHYWLVEYQEGNYTLSRYTATGKTKLVFQSDNFFRVLDQVPDKPLLLVRHNWQLQLLNTESGELIPVSIKTQSIEHASFSLDASKVYFAENVAGKWHINLFDLNTRLQHRLLDGYRVLLPYGNKYIAVTEMGNVRVLDQDWGIERDLPFSLNLRNTYRLFVRNNTLIVVNRLDSSDWLLMQYDLINKNLVKNVVKSNQLGTEVSVGKDGRKLLYVKDKEASSKLVFLGYNFGYN